MRGPRIVQTLYMAFADWNLRSWSEKKLVCVCGCDRNPWRAGRLTLERARLDPSCHAVVDMHTHARTFDL